MNGKVAVIVVTYNHSAYISECILSVRRQSWKDLALLIVDNGSTDDTVRQARALGAEVIEPGENTGYARGNNIGAEHAEASGADFLLFLNPDTVCHERMVEEMVRTLSKDDRTAAAQAKVMLLREMELLNTDGIIVNFLYFSYCGGYRKKDTGGGDREIAVGSGSCLMVRRGAAKAFGGLFKPDFFMYHEDTDLCIRARLMGKRCMLSDGAVVWHDYRFHGSGRKFFHMEKNRLFLLAQNYKAVTLAALLPAILFTEMQVLGYSAMKGWFINKAASYVWLIKNLRFVRDNRKAVQSRRVVEDWRLMENFCGEISFEEISNPALKYITNPALKAYFAVLRPVLKFLAI